MPPKKKPTKPKPTGRSRVLTFAIPEALRKAARGFTVSGDTDPADGFTKQLRKRGSEWQERVRMTGLPWCLWRPAVLEEYDLNSRYHVLAPKAGRVKA